MSNYFGITAATLAMAYSISAVSDEDVVNSNLPSDDEPDPTRAAMIAAEQLRHEAALDELDRLRAARNFERDRLAAIRAENETRPKSRQVLRAEARAAAKRIK